MEFPACNVYTVYWSSQPGRYCIQQIALLAFVVPCKKSSGDNPQHVLSYHADCFPSSCVQLFLHCGEGKMFCVAEMENVFASFSFVIMGGGSK